MATTMQTMATTMHNISLIPLQKTDETKFQPVEANPSDIESDNESANSESAPKIPGWLSLELRLDDFNIKSEQFEITGWINVFWKWKSVPPDVAAIFDVDKCEIKSMKSRIITYKVKKQTIVNIGDLRGSAISYYLPIDAEKIFNPSTLLELNYITAPSLIYNKDTKIAHTQYHINATLLQCLQLFMFPFDRQFLDIKLRWNADYYRLLDYDKEHDRRLPLKYDWFGKKDSKEYERNIQLHYMEPINISRKQSLSAQVILDSPEKDFRIHFQEKGADAFCLPNGLRAALIRIRVRRKSKYVVRNIIIPFFIIVSCSFTVFAISPKDIADRMSVSLTILLTFSVFQSLIAEQLPQSEQMLLIDAYIFIGYLLQSLIIICSCVVSSIDTIERIEFIERCVALVCGLLWFMFFLFYVSLATGGCRSCYDKIREWCCCCDCCGLKRVYFNDWQKRGKYAIDKWVESNVKAKSYKKIDPDEVREQIKKK